MPVKVDCGKCKNCSDKKKEKVQGTVWTAGNKEGDDRKLNNPATGESRQCPDWAVHEVPEVVEADDEDVEDLPEWISHDAYGPKCDSCGARKNEDHCASCPNGVKGRIPLRT
jgi:hypothetical protein